MALIAGVGVFCSTLCGLVIALFIGTILYGRKKADAKPEPPAETPEPAAPPEAAPEVPTPPQVPPAGPPQTDPLPPLP